MGTVRTVTGDVDSGDLGITDAHEHILIRGGMPVTLDRDFLLGDRGHAVRDLADFTRGGGHTLVDMMPPGLGRDPEGLQAVSREAGVLLVAATGFHTEKYYDTEHWLYRYSAEEIVNFIRLHVKGGQVVAGTSSTPFTDVVVPSEPVPLLPPSARTPEAALV